MSLKALRILTLSAMLGGSVVVVVFGADSRLADAVQRDDKAAVRSLVADRANINVPQSDGTTALHWAVRHSDLTTADLLIKAGADVKAANRYGLTPIQLAASNGHAAMIEKLLASGVDPNFANSGGETVLMTASRTGNVDAIKLLLARGANVNAKESERGQTALMWAVLENHADAVKLLLARGADINAKTTARTIKGEYTPARAAGAAGPGIIRQRALPTAEGGMTALLFAVRDGNAPMARLLLDSGADIQLASANDTSPLIIAILNGQTEIASYLLNRGANPNAIDAYKRGPLFAAIELRNFNHEKYSDLPTDGRDPLDLIKALLAKGANPNQQTNDAEVMKLLLQYKADAKITTDGGTTSLMAAAGINWIPAQTYMHSEDEYVEAVNLCLAQGVDVNAANSMGLTAMHGAANRGWESIVQILADHGSKLDPKDKEGRTPMTFAQGIFLAIKPPEPKPKAMALLNKLMGQK